ncbi:MAG: phage holin family protein [Polyangiaceae bacterium]
MSSEEASGERSIAELLGELASETATLVRQEATLASRELGEKATVGGRQVVILVISLLLATVSLMTLVAALVIGLSAYIAAWISALVVGVGLAVLAWGLYTKAVVALSNLTPVPERTVQTLKENKSWLQQETR